MINGRLVVFTRAPEPGRVKSRIARVAGVAAATQLHRELAERTVAAAAAVRGAERVLCVGGDTGHVDVSRWANRLGAPVVAQAGGDLGTRMCAALRDGGGVLIGTDCPPLDTGYIQAALTALGVSEVVLGPAEDGGYGLIAVRDTLSETDLAALFHQVPWGTSRVLGATLDRVARLGLHCQLLRCVWDVDTVLDIARYRRWLVYGTHGN